MPGDTAIREASPTDIPESFASAAQCTKTSTTPTPSSSMPWCPCLCLPQDRHGRRLLRAWLAAEGDRVVAGGAVIISPWPAHPYDLECRRATILNVYTDPEYRRRGIARQLMQTIIA